MSPPAKAIFGKKGQAAYGLDIGSHSIKLVKISPPDDPQRHLLAFGSKELSEGAIVEKDIRDREGLIYALQTLFEEVAPEALDVVINVAGHKVFTDRIQVATASKKMKMEEAVMIEAEQRIPTGTSGIVLDYYSLGKTDNGKKEDLILVAVRRELVEEYFNIVRDAGLDPVIMDIDFFANYNAFEFNYGIPEEGSLVLVNIGHTLTNLTFIIDGTYYTVRDVSSGAREIWNSLQSELRLSADDLTEMIKGDFPMEDDTPYRDAISSAIDELKLGLDVAFGYITNVTGGINVEQVYLSGGGALIQGLPDSLATKLGIPVEVMNPFKAFTPGQGVFSGKDPDKVAALYTNAIGLALRAQ